jgi:pimeloyl-ACP methyl ester carboxylesterase
MKQLTAQAAHAPHTASMLEPPEFPSAFPSERQYDFDSDGQRLRLHEWGDPHGSPLVLCHGLWDHAHGFDLLAPYLAERYRVIAIDARGHGDSGWVDNYTWPHMVYDVVHVLRRVAGARGAYLVGHSYGGGLATHAACVAPELVQKLVNMEGFGPGTREHPLPGGADFPDFGSVAAFRAYLDIRRKAHGFMEFRPYAELDQLVARRKRMNPRLSDAWLRYFCWHGSRRSADGWRWKADPNAGLSAGPFKSEWVGRDWQYLKRPMLAVVADQPDTWGPLAPEVLNPRLHRIPLLERAVVPGTGHFPHMEQPQATARLLLDYLQA